MPHISQPRWNPADAPTLWQLMSGNGTPEIAPSNSATIAGDLSGTGDNSKIAVSGGGADVGGKSLQITIGQKKDIDYKLSKVGVTEPSFSVSSNNSSIISFRLINGTTLRIRGLKAGYSSIRIQENTSGDVRFLGARVLTASGGLPGIPDYLSIGSVSEDTSTDLNFWNQYGEGNTNKRVDIRYIYINGGPVNGWRTWSSSGQDGGRVISYIRESKKRGIIPFFVYYNIPSGSEGYQADKQHIQDASYMASYFKDLKFFLDIVRREGGDDTVGIVLEPDFIGYMMQQSNGKNPTPLDQLPAQTNAIYSSSVLTPADRSFPNTIQGLIQAINYTIKKYAPNAYFGWQFNLWASPGITVSVPSNGIMHLTDTMGITAGRSAIANEARQVANYYLKGGIATHGASFISVDKYGLDGAAIPGSAENPSSSIWLWNADHWNNYLLYVKMLRNTTNLPVILWQVPVGHINSSLAKNPYPSQDGLFPKLDNTATHYEDSAPTFFLGDTFTPGSTVRFNHFATNKGKDPKITTKNNNTIQWESHMQEARDAGVISILFGAGVGASTDGSGSPPTDGYWWITQVQRYYQNPVPFGQPGTN